MSTYSNPEPVSRVFERVAVHYGRRPFPDGIRIPCPAHGGDDDNCAVFLNEAGEVRAKCYSHGCETGDVLRAIELATGIERLNPGHAAGLWRAAEERGGTEVFHEAAAARAEECARWDAFVAVVAESMGAPTPFPTEPPSDTPMADLLRWERDNPGKKFRPALRTDNLPTWAADALKGAMYDTDPGN